MPLSGCLTKQGLRTAAWILVLGGFVVAALCFASARRTRHFRQTPVAAYLLPMDQDSRIQFHPWHKQRLLLPLAIRSGSVVSVPAGSRILVVQALTGESRTVAGPARLALETTAPAELRFLASSLSEVCAAVDARLPNATSFAVTSPVGITRFLNPVISWTGQPGILYDVAVIDTADGFVPHRIATRVRSPLALSELETPQRRQLGSDRNYQILVRETASDQIAGLARCLTAPDAKIDASLPSDPVGRLLEAIAAMTQRPYRTGDAWLALSSLPEDWKKTELGIRLRLCVAAELNLKNELVAARTDAARLLGR